MFSESLIEVLLEAMPTGLVLCDHEGRIVRVNEQIEEIFRYSRQELLGMPIETLLPHRFRSGHSAHRAGFLADPRPRRMGVGRDLVALRKDGTEVPVEIALNPLATPEGVFVLASVVDITERKRAEEDALRRAVDDAKTVNLELEALNDAVAHEFVARERAEAELRRAREVAEAANRELEAFSYSVAHDLRAPLRSINGFSQALLEDCFDRLDDDGKKYLGYVRRAARHMGALIDDLLNLSRVTRAELRREPVDVTALARSTLDQLRRDQPGREVEVVVQDGLVAEADPRLLEIVLVNLLGNAWKFTGKRAAARIELAGSEGRPTVFSVRDNGAGFNNAYVTKLFGVFQRLHRAEDFEGTGIGLATVERIVRRHGGRVWADGELDRGATFRFTLEEA